MEKKNFVIGGLVLVIMTIIVLIIFAAFKGNDKDKDKKEKKDNKPPVKYEIKDEVYGDLLISNISVDPLEDQTVVKFTVKNTSSETRPEGMLTFIIEQANVPTEEVTNYMSAIGSNEEVAVEIVINGVYTKIDNIAVRE